MKFALITVVCIVSIVFLYWVIPLFVKKALKRSFLSRAHGSGAAFLTFDDGPDPSSTPRILELLDRYDAHACFFVVGRKAEHNPELIKRIISGGHAIGEHGYSHIHPWKTGPMRTTKDLINASRVFNSGLFPGDITLYRPPYGKFNIINLLYYLLKRKKPVFWDIDSLDYKTHKPEAVAENVNKRMRPGCVVLLHDGRQNTRLSSAVVTINALEQILKTAVDKGIPLESIDSVFDNTQ